MLAHSNVFEFSAAILEKGLLCIKSDAKNGQQYQNKQNRNWFYFNFSLKCLSFIFNNFKTEKLKFAW